MRKNGMVPIHARITINGDQAQFSLKTDIFPDMWSPKEGRASGKSKEASQINSFLNSVRGQLQTHFRNLSEFGEVVTADMLRNAFLGFDVKNNTLLATFKEFNDRHEKLIGIEIAQSTFNKYDLTYRRIEEFLKVKMDMKDIPIHKVNLNFIMDFDSFLRVDLRLDVNSAEKLMRIFKRIMKIAQANGLINIDPFCNHKIKKVKKDRGFLRKEELERIMAYKAESCRMEKVKDIFVFCCFTGLDYSSVSTLTVNDLVTGFDNDLWIIKDRIKTGIKSPIKLLDVPLSIIKKYEKRRDGDRILPVMSNAKYNQYLKELASDCGIDKTVTSHTARHTFATTVTLANGVSIESVSKMLGHTNIRTTQIYARILDEKVGKDMDELAGKIHYSL